MCDVETVIEAQNGKEREAQAKRIATLERENAELKVWVERWKQIAETNARIVATDKTLREIDAAIQPKELTNG